MPERTPFGILLKRYRQAAGLTQDSLAERAGLSYRAISDLERGINRTPRYATLELLIAGLSLSPQQGELLKAAARPGAGSLPGGAVRQPQPGLPLPPNSMIGREVETYQALDLLQRKKVRLLTLTGTSGVGKTRLALQLAHDLTQDFPDGVVYIPLAQIRDESLIPGALAQALRIREKPSGSILVQEFEFLQDKQMMLVLDNLEQVPDCSPFIANLLASCPYLVILATSRSPLRLRAEQEVYLDPLPANDAISLFCERAQAINPGQVFPQDEVASICEQLDRLPLAIELAATHTRLLSLPELHKRLAHRLDLLRAGARDLPPRQRTMEEAIAWSYDLLTERVQRCFRASSVFVGGWTLEAAEAICWTEEEAASGEGLLSLSALVEASLVRVERSAGKAFRFSMLELIKEYAFERLEAADEKALYQRRHAAYFAQLASMAGTSFENGLADHDSSLARDLANAQAALQWAEANRQAEIGLQLSGFARLWHMLGQTSQAERWLERTLELDSLARSSENPVAPLALRIERLYGLGRLSLSRGRTDRAEGVTMEALQLARQIGDENGLFNSWATLGLIAQARGELDVAENALNQSMLHANLVGDERAQYRTMMLLAEIARGRGELARAAGMLEQALASAQDSGSGWDIAIITILLGHLASQQRNFPLAKARYREGLVRLDMFDSPTYSAWCLEGCAAVLLAEGRVVGATRLCAASAKLREEAGTPLPDVERQSFDPVVAESRVYLGEKVFTREWEIGAGFTQSEAIRAALSGLE